MASSRKRRALRLFLGLALLGLACEQIWRHGHDYVFADKLAAVEPDRIYRGAWQHSWPMRRIIRDHHIKTIVALAHDPRHHLAVQEKALADELGVRWLHIPIVDDRDAADGKSVSDLLEDAADAVAKPENQPVYFHCHHGINRASMVQMAYRTKHCGWTLEQATEEISRTFGLIEVSKGPDYRRVARFYEERVLPARRAQARANDAVVGLSAQ